MNLWISSLLSLMLIASSTTAIAVSGDKLPSKKRTEFKLYLSAQEANNMVTKNAKNTLFLDIRTRAEINFLGMPSNADANIPYFTPDAWDNFDSKKKVFKLAPNSNFLTAVDERLQAKGLSKNDAVLLICRSGSRSAKAANLMKKAGYKKVYTIVDGFEGDKSKSGKTKGQRVVNGWKNSSMPWSYKLDQNKMYTEM